MVVVVVVEMVVGVVLVVEGSFGIRKLEQSRTGASERSQVHGV